MFTLLFWVLVTFAAVNDEVHAQGYDDMVHYLAVTPDSQLAKVDAINRYWNRHIVWKSDMSVHHVLDYWQSARETRQRRTGDCEDFAIVKIQMLLDIGVDPQDTGVMILLFKGEGESHAVAYYIDRSGVIYILDSNIPYMMSFKEYMKQDTELLWAESVDFMTHTDEDDLFTTDFKDAYYDVGATH